MVRRVVTVVVLVAALALVSSRATATTSGAPSAGPCTASALTTNLTNVVSVARFGCEDTWAYVWVNADVAGNQVSVTDLMTYTGGGWQAVSRAAHCQPSALPDLVYRGACLSN